VVPVGLNLFWHALKRGAMKSLYESLELPRTASTAEIKAAYRRLALVHHPDKGGDPEKFKDITKAYEVLGDEGRRKLYDITGSEEDMDIRGEGRGFGPGMGGGGMPPFPFPFDLGAMFGGMFGGGGMGVPGGGGPRRGGEGPPRAKKAPPKLHETPISLYDYYHGKTITMQYERKKFCGGCKGAGATEWEACGGCGGSGQVQKVFMMGPGMQGMMHGPCDACRGVGRRVKTECGECKGTKFVLQQRKVEVVIEPGIRPGESIVFAGECSDQLEFEEAGDLHILLVQAHEEGAAFMRMEASLDTLMTNICIGVCDALVGTTVKRMGHPGHPDGLDLVIPAGVMNGEIVKIPGEGMPVQGGGGQKGDLHVHVKVAMTESEKGMVADPSIREQIRALFHGGRA
jgi:DnaJ family protein A protein 2